jgi:molybdenum cofactor biosynthesis protein B
MGSKGHKKDALKKLNVAVLSVSSTRQLAEDKSGHWISRRAKREGHSVVYHQVIPDDREVIQKTLTDIMADPSPHAVILTGGTGISPKDVTIEAVRPLFDKELTAFGPLFSQLSFEDIDSAAILSRATAGIVAGTAVFCIPGSLKAVKLACKVLIFPELGHVLKHVKEA